MTLDESSLHLQVLSEVRHILISRYTVTSQRETTILWCGTLFTFGFFYSLKTLDTNLTCLYLYQFYPKTFPQMWLLKAVESRSICYSGVRSSMRAPRAPHAALLYVVRAAALSVHSASVVRVWESARARTPWSVRRRCCRGQQPLKHLHF